MYNYVALLCCLFDLACFSLPSASLTNMYIHVALLCCLFDLAWFSLPSFSSLTNMCFQAEEDGGNAAEGGEGTESPLTQNERGIYVTLVTCSVLCSHQCSICTYAII